LVVERYTALLAADRALLLPVVGSLFDLPLSGSLAARAASLAIDALDVVRNRRCNSGKALDRRERREREKERLEP
jgi:hypothetical protein